MADTFYHRLVFNIFHPIFKILSLCAKAYQEHSQKSKGLIIIWRFSARAENLNLVKRAGKINIIWAFSSVAKHFSPRAEFPRLPSLKVSDAVVRRYSVKRLLLNALQNS